MFVFREGSSKKSIKRSLPCTTPSLQQSITSHISLVFSIINVFTHHRQLCATSGEAEHVAILALLMEGREKVLCDLPGGKLLTLMCWQVLDSIEKRRPFLLPPNTCSPWEMCCLTFSSDQLVPSRTQSKSSLSFPQQTCSEPSLELGVYLGGSIIWWSQLSPQRSCGHTEPGSSWACAWAAGWWFTGSSIYQFMAINFPNLVWNLVIKWEYSPFVSLTYTVNICIIGSVNEMCFEKGSPVRHFIEIWIKSHQGNYHEMPTYTGCYSWLQSLCIFYFKMNDFPIVKVE